MKNWLIILFAIVPNLAFAAGANVPLDEANNDLSDKASLQNGAKLFVNYCFGCHSMQYQRYERVARDIGVPNDLIKALLEEFLTDGTEASFASLPFEELLVEHLTKPGDIDTTGRFMAHLLHKVLALFDPLSRWQYLVQDVLSPQRFLFHRWQSSTLFHRA